MWFQWDCMFSCGTSPPKPLLDFVIPGKEIFPIAIQIVSSCIIIKGLIPLFLHSFNAFPPFAVARAAVTRIWTQAQLRCLCGLHVCRNFVYNQAPMETIHFHILISQPRCVTRAVPFSHGVHIQQAVTYCFCLVLGATSCTQVWLLALCTGITHGGFRESYWILGIYPGLAMCNAGFLPIILSLWPQTDFIFCTYSTYPWESE